MALVIPAMSKESSGTGGVPNTDSNLGWNGSDGSGKTTQLKICYVNNVKKTFKITLQSEMLHHGGNDSICPVAFCRKRIPKNRSIEDHIRLHLSSIFTEVQQNGLEESDDAFSVEYHCPEGSCKYSDVRNLGFFPRVKYLKQHYLKIHAPKTLKCPSCQKTFAAQSYLRIHQVMCGKSFICSCGVSYSTLEALQTHARRKGHTFDIAKYKGLLSDEKGKIVKKNSDEAQVTTTPLSPTETVVTSPCSESSNTSRKYPLLLPKTNSTAMMDVVDIRNQFLGTIICEMPPSKTTIDFGTQTVAQHYSNSHHSNASNLTGHNGSTSRKPSLDHSEPNQRIPKRKQSAQTQTGRVRVRVSTETQTTNVVKRRRTNRKQQSAEAQTQCQRESPPKSAAPTLNSFSTTDSSTTTNNKQTVELMSSLKEVSIATSISDFEGDSLFFKEMEAHMQTQTEPDLFLGGENFLSDYDVHVDDSDVSNFLNLMTRETQTAHSSLQSWPSLIDIAKADMEVPIINGGNSGGVCGISDEPLSGTCGTLAAPVSTATTNYLETMDNETQTQLYDFCSIFSKMFD